MLEYGLALCLIAVVAVAALTVVGRRVGGAFCQAGSGLTTQGCSVYGWGNNSDYQIASSAPASSLLNATAETWTGGPIIAIAAGGVHVLALQPDGTVWAWGRNDHGQLGQGTNCTPSPCDIATPVSVPGIKAVAIAAGLNHSLALRADGAVFAWGANDSGQLGDGTTTDHYGPTQVPGLSGVKAMATGRNHTLVQMSDNTVRSWGLNDHGQLGNNSLIASATPVTPVGLGAVAAIASGGTLDSSEALRPDGTVWSWGDGQSGELGNGTTGAGNISQIPVAVDMTQLNKVVAIATAGYSQYAVKADGTAWSWGSNAYGQLGNNTTVDALRPVQVGSLTGVVGLAGGTYHAAALRSDGSVWAWGSNTYGQLGNGGTTQSLIPVQATGVTAVSVSAGAYFTMVTVRQPS